MPVNTDHALLVTLQSSGGLRQTFFNRQRIKLSRLAMLPPGGSPGHATYVLGEIEKIRRYLNSLRQLPHDSPLDVFVVGSRPLLTDITRQSPDSLTTRHHLLELDEVAELAGMKGPYGSEYSDSIFAHILAKKRLPNQYAPPHQTRHNTMHLARIGLIAASVLIVVLSLFVSVTNVVETVIAAGDTVSAKQQTAFYDERYEIARRRMPKIPAEPQDIKSAVEMVGKLRAFKTTPRAMVVTLSQGLTDFPLLKLESIDWVASTDPDRVIGLRRQRGNAQARSTAAAGDSKLVQLYQLAHIKGRVDPFNGDYREALAMVRQFAATLLALPEVEAVNVVELPLDIGSDSALHGDMARQSGVAPFELRVVIRDKSYESS
jgi:hypothetical protein